MPAAPPSPSAPATLRGKVVPSFSVYPEDLVLIKDRKHPLYDERVHWPVNEALVRSIMLSGVIHPILVRRNGPRFEVVDGRQHTKAAVEANRRLVKEGKPRVKVVVFPRGGQDREHTWAMVAGNVGAASDDHLLRAGKAQRLLHLGYTIDEVATMHHVTRETVENWLKLNDLHGSVRAYVARGKVKYTVAMRLAALPREEQVPKLREILAAGATNANAVRAVINGKLERVQPPTRQQLRRLADAFHKTDDFLADEARSDIYAFASWVLGRISTDEFLAMLSSPGAGPVGDAVRAVMKQVKPNGRRK